MMHRRRFLQYITMAASAVAINPIKALEVKEVGHWIEVEGTLLKLRKMNAAQMASMECACRSLSDHLENVILDHFFYGNGDIRRKDLYGIALFKDSGGRLE